MFLILPSNEKFFIEAFIPIGKEHFGILLKGLGFEFYDCIY